MTLFYYKTVQLTGILDQYFRTGLFGPEPSRGGLGEEVAQRTASLFSVSDSGFGPRDRKFVSLSAYDDRKVEFSNSRFQSENIGCIEVRSSMTGKS